MNIHNSDLARFIEVTALGLADQKWFTQALLSAYSRGRQDLYAELEVTKQAFIELQKKEETNE